MARKTNLIWQRVTAVAGWFRRPALRSSDTGIFDPYLSLGKVHSTNQDLTYEQEAADADPFFSEQVLARRQFFGFKAVVVLVVLGLLGRMMVLQISQGQENYVLAEGNRLKAESIVAPRGLFLDRNGAPLVQNIPSFSVILSPQSVPKKDEQRQQFIAQLATALRQPEEEVDKIVTANAKRDSVTLEEGLDRERALSVELRLNGIEGVELVKSPSRFYGTTPGLGHILGYTGKASAEDLKERPNLLPVSFVGKTGLESSYDEYLQGKPGIETLEVDSSGRKIRSVGIQPSIPGNSLLLSIDAQLQTATANALLSAIEKNNATSGAAVAIDPRSGEVLAMVSAPLFDNNIFSRTADQEQRRQVLANPLSPLVNRAISGQYPSGSTIKPAVAAAALQEKVVSPSTKIDTSSGKITVGQWTFPDWKVHGITDVRQSIAESNNIFFYTVGGGHGSIGGLGANRLSSYLEKFGFGRATGIDIPGETNGLVPTPDWKKKVKKESWYIGDTYNLSIGQGDLLVTPLQLTRATAAIANGGTLYQPKLVKTIVTPTGAEARDVLGKIEKTGLTESGVLSVVREGMRQTVTSGSARSFSTLPFSVAAKTGTAQFNVAKDRTHSWFTAFAPYEKPEIAISVIVEGGGEGYSVAAPVARNILEQYYRLPLTPIVSASPAD